ncbi:hypothetical protein MBM_04366 [Drepanopeziza brunnea f. sp. 'multigermtubi' MB_m1]|uniref:Uncharacterized protein n=1 Tax=Marssonina brunnea f. sp. multigermtubi (strain MB_m1) TaxID=1072389 RepID=K1WIM2_MARBU|nr:uncharacterized protein MBM_04366 [Drepanopeziza brunnea f. sp. 'multigermtubi' MB_m1]EKD17505.1 hypothetical protein MBM_04366 [Drepanopeziza brunnea f. sp. 'multigermtubi' MB_m1]
MLFYLASLLLHACGIAANTEKTIFLGPRSLQVPVEHPTLEDLQLESLSPNHWSLRTHIRAEFPTNSSSYGQTSWYLLHNLHEGRRYEVRICWAATQPTSFRLDTFELPTVMETPELIASLAQYSETRQREVNEGQEKDNRADGPVSTLLLRIFAAADYFTTNKTLMDNVPPVYVDIILDPFVFNVFPRSLLPTATYLVLVAVGSWYLAKFISGWMENISRATFEKKIS